MLSVFRSSIFRPHCSVNCLWWGGWVLQGPASRCPQPSHRTDRCARTVPAYIARPPTYDSTSSMSTCRRRRTSGITAPYVARNARLNTTSSTTNCKHTVSGNASPMFSETSSTLFWQKAIIICSSFFMFLRNILWYGNSNCKEPLSRKMLY